MRGTFEYVPKFLKSGANKTIGHVNEKIGHVKEAIQSVELESNNETTTCEDKYIQTLSAYNIKGKVKTLRKSEKRKDTGWLGLYL